MSPTPRALALRESLDNIFLDIKQLVKAPVFLPELAQGMLRVATSDYITTVILPPLLKPPLSPDEWEEKETVPLKLGHHLAD